MSSRGEMVYDVLRQLRPLVLNSARVVGDRVSVEGWTVGMRAVIEILVDGGDATVPAIAQRMDLPRQAVQRHVNDLKGLDHVETRVNPAHRRSVLVTVTKEGRRAFTRMRRSELAELSTLAPERTADELRIAAEVLADLNRDVRTKAAPHSPQT